MLGKTTIFWFWSFRIPRRNQSRWSGIFVKRPTLGLAICPKNAALMPKLTVLNKFATLGDSKRDAKEVKEKLPQWMKRLKWKESRKIKSPSKESEDSAHHYSDFMSQTDYLDELFQWLDPAWSLNCSGKLHLQEKERGVTITFSDHVITSRSQTRFHIRDGHVSCIISRQDVPPIRKNASLCFSEQVIIGKSSRSNRWVWPNKRWKLILRSWKELFPPWLRGTSQPLTSKRK